MPRASKTLITLAVVFVEGVRIPYLAIQLQEMVKNENGFL